MKKLFNLILVVVLTLSFGVNALAVTDNKTDSISDGNNMNEDALKTYYKALEAMKTDDKLNVDEDIIRNEVNTTLEKNQTISLSQATGLNILCVNALQGFDMVIPQVAGGKEYLFLPSSANLNNIIFKFNPGIEMFIKSKKELVPVMSGEAVDITKFIGKENPDGSKIIDLVFTINGNEFDYQLYVMKSANIASVFLKSEDPIKKGLYYVASNKTYKIKGTMDMVNADGSLVYSGPLSQIKTRGNSTWASVKKPFQIKLDKKVDLIETGNKENENKTWILLANAYDPTLMHNAVAYDLAKNIGINAPDCRFVDLYFDGKYLGNYLLSEKVEIGKGRVDAGNNGCLLEMDLAYYNQEENYFVDVLGTPFVIKEPEDISDKLKAYAENYMNDVILAANNGGISPNTGLSVSDLVDIDILSKLYLLEETVKDPDAFVSSNYFMIKEGGKLVAGPVWDFDSAFGIKEENNMTLVAGACSYPGWIGYFYNLPEFKDAIKKNKPVVYKMANTYINGGIDKMANSILASQKMDSNCWQDFELGMYNELPTFKQNVSYFKNFFSKRNVWVKNNIK